VALRLAPIDRWTLAYLAFATVALLWPWRARPPQATAILAGYALLAGVALSAPALRRRGGSAGFLGEFYALLAAVGLYTAIGLVNRAAGVSHDGVVQAWEQAMSGGQPSREWIRAAPWPWLSRVLHAGYLSYYFILAGAPLALWLSGRREGARRVTLAMMATFYICYAIFLVFPVAGPRYFFSPAANAATGTAIARLTHRLLDAGAAWGTAFPSSHVAVSLVAAGTAMREWRPLGAVLLVAASLLTLGTVYGQLHYAVDAVAGACLAAVVVAVSRGIMRARIGG
jgi:membrane-associated phospholipid phosphatase